MGQAKRRGSFEDRKNNPNISKSQSNRFSRFDGINIEFKNDPFYKESHSRLIAANVANDNVLANRIGYELYRHYSRRFQPSDINVEDVVIKPILQKAEEMAVELWVTPPGFLLSQQGGFCGKNLMVNGVAKIFVDPIVGRYENVDTILHELAHATGPVLGRWEADNQPALEWVGVDNRGLWLCFPPYLTEEYVAIDSASILSELVFGIPASQAKREMQYRQVRQDYVAETMEIDIDEVRREVDKVIKFWMPCLGGRAGQTGF